MNILKIVNRKNSSILYKIGPKNQNGKIDINNIQKRFSSSSPPDVEVFINNQRVLVKPGTTIMQAAATLGMEIPRFCYHPKLSIAGNCRMCLVEVEKIPKPIASCAMPVVNGWRIHTDSDMAKKAREGVMEFLLINHPLDCPICDQGGECDLQDQSQAFGSDKSRFTEANFTGKRAVEDKNIGCLVKTIMTRCIHCTRCIRFMTEIAGDETLGTTGRGNDMQIGTYLEKMLKSELSGNIIDVCPVGALTSKPDQFSTRPWELEKIESIDISDAVGSNIIVGVRTSDVKRILPCPNDEINEDWISDKARFMYDGLSYQRLMVPLVRNNNSFKPIDWMTALKTIAKKFYSAEREKIYAVAGQLNDAESLTALRDLFHSQNCENLYTEDMDHPEIETGVDFRSTYTMNNTIQNIENADLLVLVGICPRYEATLINARIRKSFIHSNLKILLVGDEVNLTYPYEYIGWDYQSLVNLFNGAHSSHQLLNGAERPMIIMGTSLANTPEGSQLFKTVYKNANIIQSKLKDKSWNVFNVIHRNTGYLNALDLGYKPKLPSLEDAQLIYILGADNGVLKTRNIKENAFVVYQGHHGDEGAQIADLIIPGSAYTEKDGTYVNVEGRAQTAFRCVTSPGEAREDWKIIKALSNLLGSPLKYENIYDLRKRMYEIAPHFASVGNVEPIVFQNLVAKILKDTKKSKSFNIKSRITKLQDFYMTDSISRHSKTMAQCVSDVQNLP